jgi:hypothetical protein
VTYDPIPASASSFLTAPGQYADLIAFKLRQDPGLPVLAIASSPPATGAEVVMIGKGRNRGAWNGVDGWLSGAGSAMRWGTNRVAGANQNVTLLSWTSRVFWTDFTETPPPQVTPHEAQAAVGDSGGAAFVWNGDAWDLGGVLFAVGSQTEGSARFGDQTLAVDLSLYRSAILAVTTRPACSDALDDDADGLVDFPNDPGCASADDLDERSPLLACDDGADSDLDGKADYLALGGGDPGCASPASTRENPRCQDGLDNDNAPGIDFDGGASLDLDQNGFIDAQFNAATPAVAQPDPFCTSASKERESPRSCGLGFEIAFLAPWLARLARNRRA